MAVRKFKPMTPGTRHKVIGTFDDITSSTPEKSLLSPLKSSGGRNNSGKMTVTNGCIVLSISNVTKIT